MKKDVRSKGVGDLLRKSRDRAAQFLTMVMVTALLVYIYFNIIFG